MYMQTKQENVQVCNSYDTIVVVDDLSKSNMCARQQECGRCPRRTGQPRFLQPPEVIGGTKVDAHAQRCDWLERGIPSTAWVLAE